MNSRTPSIQVSIAGHLRVPRNTKLFAAACERWLVGRKQGTVSFREQHRAESRKAKEQKDGRGAK